MKKSIETDGKNYTVHTVNGVNTRTGTIWAKEIKVFQPLPNGFNADLANHVYDIITANERLWDQGVWRRPINVSEIYDTQELAELDAALSYDRDKNDPVCGTAMCLAGWIGEVSGADYAYDSMLLKQLGVDAGLGTAMETVLITHEQAAKWGFSGSNIDGFFSMLILDRLKERGFSSKTHTMMSIGAYAEYMLGITGDPLDLFGGDNTLPMIRAIIDIHTEFGPHPDDDVHEAWIILKENGIFRVPTPEEIAAARLQDADY